VTYLLCSFVMLLYSNWSKWLI